MIVHLQRRPGPSGTAKSPSLMNPGDLLDRGLLAQWFIRYRLGEEMAEARRYRYPLCVVILSPMLVAGDPDAEARLRMGAAAARDAARASDLIGWLDGGDILFVLPHADATAANAAIERWRTEMIRQTEPFGVLKWLAASMQDAGQFRDADDLVTAALHQFRGID